MTPPHTTPVVILGGGLTGLSVAFHLQRPWILLEKEDRLGGLARTDERDGFRFDKTGHWLHTRSEYVKGLVEKLLPGDPLVSVERQARIFSHGVLTRYPFQSNLHGLPPAVVRECLLGFVRAWSGRQQPGGQQEPRNFEEFILRHFGVGIAEHFMIPYNRKLWGVHPREITSSWCDRFVPIPELEQVVDGALGTHITEVGYNATFQYPRGGGIETLTGALASRVRERGGRVHLDTSLRGIDPGRRKVIAGDRELDYGAIVSTIPLPELIRRIKGIPRNVELAAARLRCTPVRYLNIALRKPPRERLHWMYVPEEKYPFYRAGIFSNAAPSMAPPGRASMYVELSAHAPTSPKATLDSLVRGVVHGLIAAGLVEDADDVLFAELRELEHAYVVFDENHQADTSFLLSWLRQHDIHSCGRYGSWTYNAMEDCLLAGREVAQRLDRARLSDTAAIGLVSTPPIPERAET